MYRILFGLIALTQIAHAAPASNAFLKATMGVVSADLKVVAAPALAGNPATVKDEAILTAIVRSRTAASQLQLVSDRAEGETFPPMLAGLPEAQLKEKLGVFRQMLAQAKSELEATEGLLKAELAKGASERTFKPLLAQLNTIQGTMQKAHGLFRPPTP